MPSDSVTVPLGWSGRALPIGTHMCFYYSDDAGLRGTLSFVRIGLDDPDAFCVIFADQARFRGLVDWLSEGYEGDIDSLIAERKLALIGGEPTVEGLLTSIGSRLDEAVAQGFRVIRFLGFIGWGRPGWPDEAGLLEFERRVNAVVTAYPAVIICTLWRSDPPRNQPHLRRVADAPSDHDWGRHSKQSPPPTLESSSAALDGTLDPRRATLHCSACHPSNLIVSLSGLNDRGELRPLGAADYL